MKRVLVIEDEIPLLNALKEILVINGFDVLTASNGKLGIDIGTNNRVDLIICDINLPDINGYDVLNEIKRNYKSFKTPFIFLSAFSDESDIRNGMNLGADDYLTKPFSMEVLINTINSRLQIAESRNIKELEIINHKIYEYINKDYSHEFTTPLNAVLNLTKILLTEKYLREDTRDILKDIYKSGYRIYRNVRMLIINTILSNSDKLAYRESIQINLSEMILKVIEEHFEMEEIELDVDSNLSVNSDYDIVKFIFEEIIDNSIKHKTPNSNETKVSLKRLNNNVLLRVSNQSGIPEKLSIKEVAPFKKFHNDMTLNGMGLGLYTVANACKALGYDMVIENNNELFEVQIQLSNEII